MEIIEQLKIELKKSVELRDDQILLFDKTKDYK